jgi:hypothetical protein
MKTLLVGDSHTGIFHGRPNIVVYGHDDGLYTARNYGELVDQPGSRLNGFYKSFKGPDTNVILCIGEVEIRAHWWKHIPADCATGKDVKSYIQDCAETLYKAIKITVDRNDFSSILLWGSPPATSRTDYNPAWPFIGSVSTRNILTHLFNCAVLECMNRDSSENRIKFATGFYDYIDPLTYLPTLDIPSDGVHWAPPLRDFIWNIVSNLLTGNNRTYLHPLFDQIKSQSFKISRTESSPTWLYDTWIWGKDLHNPQEHDRKITIDGEEYHLLRLENRGAFPVKYNELCLAINS